MMPIKTPFHLTKGAPAAQPVCSSLPFCRIGFKGEADLDVTENSGLKLFIDGGCVCTAVWIFEGNACQ